MYNKEKARLYRIKNKEKIAIQRAAYYQANKASWAIRRKDYYKKNRRACIEYALAYKKAHPRIASSPKAKEYLRRYKKARRVNDPQFKLSDNLRRGLKIRLRGKIKIHSHDIILGCSITFFKKYLEKQFQPGMGWENYGLRGWHIDHIIPCAAFDLTNKEQMLACFHYTNFQPLWAIENLTKGAKMPTR